MKNHLTLPRGSARQAVLVLALAALSAMPALAAERAANLLGYVRDASTGRAVAGASVTLETTSTQSVTNELGFFTFTDVSLGVHHLVVEALGFEERRLQVRLAEDTSYETEILLGPQPVELEGLSVDVIPRRTFNELRDLDIRLSRGFGQFVLREELDQRGGNLINAIQGMAGVRVQGGGGTISNRTVILRRAKHITSPSAGVFAVEACYPAIFVDGRRFSRRASLGDQPTDLTEFLSSDMDAVEVYSGTSVPAIFGGGDAACGAILIWMRRGPVRTRGGRGN